MNFYSSSGHGFFSATMIWFASNIVLLFFAIDTHDNSAHDLDIKVENFDSNMCLLSWT